MMAKFGKPKPIWITEICWNSHIHPYGTSELRQADLAVRFYVMAIASRRVEKVFWWTFRDAATSSSTRARWSASSARTTPRSTRYYAFAFMTRMLEGKTWVRNDSFGPNIYAVVFNDPKTDQDTIVAWSPKPYAYIRVNNTEKGLTFYDVYGTKRLVPLDAQRTASLPVPLGESPIYVVAPKGLKATPRPDPGW